MKQRVETMEDAIENTSFSVFAGSAKLPVIFDDAKQTVSNGRGAVMFRYQKLREIYIIPSAFNNSRLWGAYAESSGSLRLFFPVFDEQLLEPMSGTARHVPDGDIVPAADTALLFRALGDTTRYAMARVLARHPRTSVELAKDFTVSKATISHHVQLLRQAGLLLEKVTDKGIALSIDRDALEEQSSAAARAIFASDQPLVIKRSRNETGRRT